MAKRINLVNLTPHEVVLMPHEGGEVRIAPVGQLARCRADRQVVDMISVDGVKIPVTEVMLGELSGLSDPQPDTVFVVSMQAAQRAVKMADPMW